MQIELFNKNFNQELVLTKFGSPPKNINYFDDFNEKTINAICNDNLIIKNGGRDIKFTFQSDEVLKLAKHLTLFLVNNDLSSGTLCNYLHGLSTVGREEILELLSTSPFDISCYWNKLRTGSLITNSALMSVKWVMTMLCVFNVDEWSENFQPLISQLPLNPIDKYRSVRVGESFISIEQESKIIANIDNVQERLKVSPCSIPTEELESTCKVMFSYLFGMRPRQIADVKTSNIEVFIVDGEVVGTHVTFHMIKQRKSSAKYSMKRRLKLDWAPLVVELLHRSRSRRHPQNRLFSVDSAYEASASITKTASRWAGDYVNATILRHSAAQRLVDSGASIEEVAAFMGHSYTTTSLIYFQSSPNQAQRLNAALGLSSVMQRVIKIAREKFISSEELRELKGDQQIGGMPHGIPIAGIGGCGVGQSLCPKNPILQCYSCPSFMPVLDKEVHRQVLKDMRLVANEFAESSLNAEGSSAYVQLRPMLEGIQNVIQDIENYTHE